MSWDVLIFDAPPDVTIDQLPDGFSPAPLGAAAQVRQRLTEVLPELAFTDPAWGLLRGSTWTVEFNLGSHDPVDTFMMHVRGAGDDVLAVVAQAAGCFDARALDVSTGELLTGAPGDADGWHGFQRLRGPVATEE